jgi:hypothetical protein
MKITIDIDDSRLLDELGAVNGTGAVSRARAKLRDELRDAAKHLLVDTGTADSIIDRVIERQKRRGIIRALSAGQARSDAMVRRHANAGRTSCR